MDQFDRAQELDAYYRNQALSALKMKTTGKSHVITNHCEDCGEEIPEGRRLAAPGCTRCKDCQQIRDRT